MDGRAVVRAVPDGERKKICIEMCSIDIQYQIKQRAQDDKEWLERQAKNLMEKKKWERRIMQGDM